MEGDSGAAPKQPQQLFFDNVSPATRLLEKRRQMYEVQDALENQKARFAKEEEQFRKREETLRAKDLQLQHQLFRFNKFLQDNEAKRRRADTRASEEALQIRQKEDEMRELEKQLDESKTQCDELEEEVKRNMKYEQFLEMVKDQCEEYSEIQDLVTRYDTLESANRDLMQNQLEYETRIEDLRNEYQNYRKAGEMSLLDCTNKLASLSTKYDDTVKQRQQLEHQVDEATQLDSKHSLYFGQILMSVENLHLRCIAKRGNIIQHNQTILLDDETARGREGEQDDDPDSFAAKKKRAVRELKVILDYLKDFKDITETLRKEVVAIKKNDQTKRPQVQQMDAPKNDFQIEFQQAEARGPQDRGSQNSGSQGNTREISSKNAQQQGTGAGASSSVADMASG